MKSISLNLPDEMLDAAGRHSATLRLPRAEYIRRAVDQMNRHVEADLRARRMRHASEKCRAEDMKVYAEFAQLGQMSKTKRGGSGA